MKPAPPRNLALQVRLNGREYEVHSVGPKRVRVYRVVRHTVMREGRPETRRQLRKVTDAAEANRVVDALRPKVAKARPGPVA